MPVEQFSQKRSKIKGVSFYAAIVTAFVCLLVTAAVPIIVVGYYQNKTIVSDLGNDLIEQTSRTVIEKTRNYFLPASVAVEMSARLARLGAISPDDFNQMEMYTLGVLKSYPQVSMFYLANEQGDYIRAWRQSNGNLESRIIRAAAVPPTDSFVIRDALFNVTGVQESGRIDYDPRTRPWYVGAKTTGANFWTDIYILARNRKPAITSSYPVFDKAGKLSYVWAMDIELDEISKFLKTQKIGKSGIELIINHKSEIVAYRQPSLIVREEKEVLRPVKVEELGIEPLTLAYREHMSTGKPESVVECKGKRYIGSFTDIPEPFPKRWKIAVLVPEDDFTGGAKRSMIIMALISGFTLAIAVFLAFIVTRGFTNSVRLLAEATRKIKGFNLEEKIHIPSRMKEIQLMRDSVCSMQKGLNAFRKYVPAELVRQLISTGEGAHLGGHRRELTVLFTDITGFTSIAELMTPEELMLHLSEYFDELTRIVGRYSGTVDKYIGDAVMAFWGAPVHDGEHAVHACEAALAAQEKIAELNRKWTKEGKSAFVTRIGISTGETVVGNVGSTERMNYTVIGDNVNTASRLESANKLYGTQTIVSEETYEAASKKFWFRPLGIVAVKGKIEEKLVYELVGRRIEGEKNPAAELCKEFHCGFEAYMGQNWNEAAAIFKNLSAKYPWDTPTNFYLSRCAHFQANPPGLGWQGIEYLTSK
jgi:adenylate cyclase